MNESKKEIYRIRKFVVDSYGFHVEANSMGEALQLVQQFDVRDPSQERPSGVTHIMHDCDEFHRVMLEDDYSDSSLRLWDSEKKPM